MKYDVGCLQRKQGELTLEQSNNSIRSLITRFECYAEANNLTARTREIHGIDGRIICADVTTKDLEASVMYRSPTENDEAYLEAEFGMNAKGHADYVTAMDLIGILNEWRDQ